MLCEECGKAPATVRLEQVINGKKTVMHLCEECARKAGFFTGFLNLRFPLITCCPLFLGRSLKDYLLKCTHEKKYGVLYVA